MRPQLLAAGEGKLVKIFGAVVTMLALSLVATGILGNRTEVSARTETKVQRKNGTRLSSPGLKKARRYKEKGRLKLAAVLVEGVLNGNGSDPAAWKLYLDIALAKADAAIETENYGEAQKAYATARKALKRWRSVLVRQRVSVEDVAAQVTRDEQLQQRIDKLGERAITKAKELYKAGKRDRWYVPFWDDEALFIDALVVLDGIDVSSLSPDVRKQHAEMWDKCYAELSSGDVARYKRLSALTHGRRPQSQ